MCEIVQRDGRFRARSTHVIDRNGTGDRGRDDALLQTCRYANLQRRADGRTSARAVQSTGFNRLFPKNAPWNGLPAGHEATIAALEAIAEARRGSRDNGSANGLPAGYSYLAQLVIHDLTFTRSLRPIGIAESTELANKRSPRLDLDCIYGDGWQIDAPLFTRSADAANGRCLFRLGTAKPTLMHAAPPASDFARIVESDGNGGSRQFDPLIADTRNDIHLILSQLTLLFMRLHNRVAELALAGRLSHPAGAHAPDHAFEIARQFVVLTYRNIVFHDLLPRLLHKGIYARCLGRAVPLRTDRPGSDFSRTDDRLSDQMPYEFAFGAARAGHALTRNVYRMNDAHPRAPIRRLAQFSALSADPTLPVPADWVVDWEHFFDISHVPAQRARPLTPFYCPDFVDRKFQVQFDVDDGPALGGQKFSLSFLDLYRSYGTLPSGQACAASLAVTMPEVKPLSGDAMLPAGRNHGQDDFQARALDDVLRAKDHEAFLTDTPLSYYILQEALVDNDGSHLGPLGSYIVAETTVRALERSHLEETGRPRPPGPPPRHGSRTMAETIRLLTANGAVVASAVEATLRSAESPAAVAA